MGPKIKNNSGFLRKLNKGKSAIRKKIISKARPGQIKALCECALNACSGRIKLNPRVVKKLKKHEGNILRIAYSKEPIEIKRKLLSQSGGALPILAQIGLTALGSLLPKIFGS